MRRVQPGDTLCLFDSAGSDWPATVLAVGRSEVRVRIGEPRSVCNELPHEVTLALGMPANERMDMLVEKATELGVARLQPLLTVPPHNKDCALFEEKINNVHYCLHRPSGKDIGGNFIWQASSKDMIHWGNHKCVMKTRPGMWDSARIGAGASPIKTEAGWLEIYHGADYNNRYCLGAVLFDLHDPSIVLARSVDPIFEPTKAYETNGFIGNVVFTNGHFVEGDKIQMYYGASDEVICGATLSITEILSTLNVLVS